MGRGSKTTTKKSVSDIIQKAKSDLYDIVGAASTIPDIISFCEKKEYLNFPGIGIELTPAQQITLKVFYRGSEGNEHVTLTDEEIQLCQDYGLNCEENGDILSKFDNGTLFKQLILVWGRRSGKDFICGIIMAYEAMRLLECPGGNPYSIYGISDSQPITLLTVATAAKQAEIAFREVKARILHSPYFQNKVTREGIEASKICLLTPQDKKNNDTLMVKTKGSIEVEVGHSNSDALLGKQTFVLIFDEVASYRQSGGASSGERIYTALTPGLEQFCHKEKVIDDSGNPVFDEYDKEKTKRVLDSKLICISSPRGEDGLFHRLYKESHLIKDMLMLRLPTWKVQPDKYSEAGLRETRKAINDEDFRMEFGAEFSGTAGESFFVREKVLSCFKVELSTRETGQVGVVYFAHLDPALTSHNYAMVVLHREVFRNNENKSDFRIVVDQMKCWKPTAGKPIRIEDVDEYVLNLKRRFHLGMVTYDVWNSIQSIEKLKKAGIPAKCTHFSLPYKMAIYTQLEILINSDRVWIPRNQLLMNEMLHLRRKITAKGFRVYAPREGDVRTDDMTDSLAGACYIAMNATAHRLPGGNVVNFGGNPSSNSITWRSMQGTPYGTGTGQQVSDSMERRQPGRTQNASIPPSVFNP